MKSLRALLSALLSTLVGAFLRLRSENTPRFGPARGPTHPWAHAHVRALHAMRLRGPEPPPAERRLPARVAPPPHILALLASAPDVEPEFARRPRHGASFLATLQRAHVRVRIYNPRPAPATLTHAPRPTGASWAVRMTRAASAAAEWLLLTTPTPRGKRH